MSNDMDRADALDKSVRVSLARGGNDTDEEVVSRAEKFAAFLAEAK